MLGSFSASPRDLRLAPHGAQLFAGALDAAGVSRVLHLLRDQPCDRAGVRLFQIEGLACLLCAEGPVGGVAASMMPAPARPVRAVLFDKSASANWSLAWHQDRVIAVQERREVEGFGPWTRKGGMLHVAPPPDVLSRMVTLRVHVDPVPATNAPLLISPGSHELGRVAGSKVPSIVNNLGVAACIAATGDIWMYATPILHASERAALPTRRRVLHVDYAAEELPGGLKWLGV